jgi:hypothetical protein
VSVEDGSLWIDVMGYDFVPFFSLALFEDAWKEDRTCWMQSHRVPKYVNAGLHTGYLICVLE